MAIGSFEPANRGGEVHGEIFDFVQIVEGDGIGDVFFVADFFVILVFIDLFVFVVFRIVFIFHF